MFVGRLNEVEGQCFWCLGPQEPFPFTLSSFNLRRSENSLEEERKKNVWVLVGIRRRTQHNSRAGRKQGKSISLGNKVWMFPAVI